jgi:CARDB protein
MLRIAVILAVLAAFPAGSSAARRATTPAGPETLARLVACDVTSSNRAATFYARMETMQGASRMQVRFQLLERLGYDSWARLDVPALRQWHGSQPGVQRFGWKQTVDALRVGGAYKARVQYRWLTAGGMVLATTARDTPVCRGPLPNLFVRDLTVNPGPTPDTRSYRVAVGNTGKIDVDVEVSLTVDKATLDTITLHHLVPGDTRTLTFTGPVCRHAVRVTADPGNSIGESLENDNSQLFACP